MSRTFIVTEIVTRIWRVEMSDEETGRILSNAAGTFGEKELELCAADFISEPGPERGTITLLSHKSLAETVEAK